MIKSKPKGYTLADIQEMFLIRPLKKEMITLDIKIKETRKKADRVPLERRYEEVKGKLDQLTSSTPEPEIQPIQEEPENETEEGGDNAQDS